MQVRHVLLKQQRVPQLVQRRRQRQVRENFSRRYQAIAIRFAKELNAWYPGEAAKTVKHAEAFELCEYGSQPDQAGLRRLFPFLP